MADLKEFLDISISRETKGVSRQGFGTPLFIGNTNAFAGGELVRTYTGKDAVLEDFGQDSPEYKAANQFFSQERSPTYVKIGYHSGGTERATVTVTPVDSAVYTLTVDGVEVSYTSEVDTTAQAIVDGLEAAFLASTVQGIFTDLGDGTLTISPNNPTDFSLEVSDNLAVEFDRKTLTESIKSIREQDNDFYFVTAYTHDPEDMLEIAAYVQGDMLIYGTSYFGADAYSALVQTDPGARLQALGYSQTFVIYHNDPSSFPECAIIGEQAPKDPGSSTWKFQEVINVTPTNLSTTQSLVLKGSRYDYGKGYNTYEPVGGRAMFAEGRMVNGEFIDVIRFCHWIQARMSERIFMALMNAEKISQTSAGFTIIEGHMRAVLNEGVTVGGLSDYTITVPNPRSIDPNARANRVAEGFKFTGVLAGAVHFLGVEGRVVV